jgi:hypothetical protein
MTLFTCVQSILIGTFGTRYILHLAWSSNYRWNAAEEAAMVFSLMLAWLGACVLCLGVADLILGISMIPDFTNYMVFNSALLGGIALKNVILFVGVYTLIFQLISYYKDAYYIRRFFVEVLLFFVFYIIQLTIALLLLKSADMLLDYLFT